MSTSSQGKLVGSRGAMFRKTSTSKPDDWSDHSGKDVGAARNYAHEKTAVAKAEASKAKKEQDIINRTKAAAQRAKETLKMAKEDINEAKKFVYDKPQSHLVKMYDKKPTDDLHAMHKRWSGDHNDKKSNPSRSEDLLAVHHVLKSRGANPAELPQHKNLGMMRMHEESSGTEARVKIKNIARPDDAEPTSEKSKLSKTGEIKTKSVDEDIAASISRKYGLSSGLLEAAKGVMQGKTQVDLDPETDDREDNGDEDDDDMKKESKHTTPKSDKEKKLAALAHPKDKITHKDVLVGRGVLKKEETEIEEAIKPYVSYSGPRPGKSPSATVMAAGEKPHKTFSKDEHGADYKQKAMDYFKKNSKKLHSEEVEEIEELEKKTLGSYITKVASLSPEKVKPSREAGIEKAAKKYKMKEETDIDSLTEEELEEVLKKSDPAGKWISDFVHSKDPKFEGKSKKERMKQALGAYYAKQRNEEVGIEEGDDQFATKRRLDLIAKQEKKLPPGISPERKALAIRKQKAMKAHKAAQGMKEEEQLDEISKGTLQSYTKGAKKEADSARKELQYSNRMARDFGQKSDVGGLQATIRKRTLGTDLAKAKMNRSGRSGYMHANVPAREEIELTAEELERIESIAAQLDEAKPTIVSAPIRGANQDQSGFGVKKNTADYTISDEKKVRKEEVEELDESTLKDKITDKDGNRYELHLNVKGVSGHKDDHVIVQTHKNGKAIRKSDLGMLRSGGGNRYVSKDKSYIMKKFNSLKEEVELDEANMEDLRAKLDKHKELALAANRAGNDDKVKHHQEKMNKIKDMMAAALRKEEVELEEQFVVYHKDSKKVVSTHANTATAKKHAEKRGADYAVASKEHWHTKLNPTRKNTNEEVELEEGRGRPKKSGGETEGDDTHKHPIQQLTKISHAIEGSEPHFEHKDGAKTKIGKHLAKHVMAVYGSMRTSQEKDDFANKLHASKDSMKSAVSKLF